MSRTLCPYALGNAVATDEHLVATRDRDVLHKRYDRLLIAAAALDVDLGEGGLVGDALHLLVRAAAHTRAG